MTARLVNSSSSSNSSNRSTSSKSSGGHQEKKSKGGGGGGGSSSTTSAAGVSGGGLPNLAPSVGGVAGAVRPTDGRRGLNAVLWLRVCLVSLVRIPAGDIEYYSQCFVAH
uniref:(California timema) hypothetical protein n=1 Tax=Timema californicum TaxID=61474 RepID=A0A7R9P8T1_TIMCA|nr:unnamed protein product [Timema californicum]